VALDSLRLADVVQEEREVDQGRVLDLVQDGPVLGVMGSASVKIRSSSRMALSV
jgi:hypothetical protein